MKANIFTAALLLVVAVGCGIKSTSSGPPAARKRDELAKKLAAMPLDARAAYVRTHPEAIQTLSGQPSTTP